MLKLFWNLKEKKKGKNLEEHQIRTKLLKKTHFRGGGKRKILEPKKSIDLGFYVYASKAKTLEFVFCLVILSVWEIEDGDREFPNLSWEAKIIVLPFALPQQSLSGTPFPKPPSLSLSLITFFILFFEALFG